MKSSLKATFQLSKMIVEAQKWPRRISEGSAIDPQSSMAVDDAERDDKPVHAAAWAGLSSAVDHLAMAAHQIQRRSRFRHIGILSATRGAVVGASQAVWILSGTPSERITRALSVKRDEAFQEWGYLTDLHGDDALKQYYTEDQVEEQAEEIRKIKTLFESLDSDIPKMGGKSRVTTSTMIEEALIAYSRNAGSMHGPLIAAALQANWRVGSAAAHSRAWAYRATDATAAGASGPGIVNNLGPEQRRVGVATIAEYFQAAGLLTNEAWRLWDLSSRRPVGQAAAGS